MLTALGPLILAKRVKAGVDISVDALHGVKLLQAAATRAKGVDKQELTYAAERLRELSREDPKMAAEFAQKQRFAGAHCPQS